MTLKRLWEEYKNLNVYVREYFSLYDYVETYGQQQDLKELDSYVNEAMFKTLDCEAVWEYLFKGIFVYTQEQ